MTVTKVPTDPNMTPEVRRFLDDLAKKTNFDALTVSSLSVSSITSLVNFALGLVVATGGITVTAGGLTVTAGSVSLPNGSIASAALASPPSFSEQFVSTPQTITVGGTLTLPHGLSATPKLIQARLKNISAEAGYSVGDEVWWISSGVMALYPDATNINVVYGSGSSMYVVSNKTTGAATTLTNSNWNLIVSAWA